MTTGMERAYNSSTSCCSCGNMNDTIYSYAKGNYLERWNSLKTCLSLLKLFLHKDAWNVFYFKVINKKWFSSHLKFFFSEMMENLTRQNEEKSAQTEGMFLDSENEWISMRKFHNYQKVWDI